MFIRQLLVQAAFTAGDVTQQYIYANLEFFSSSGFQPRFLTRPLAQTSMSLAISMKDTFVMDEIAVSGVWISGFGHRDTGCPESQHGFCVAFHCFQTCGSLSRGRGGRAEARPSRQQFHSCGSTGRYAAESSHNAPSFSPPKHDISKGYMNPTWMTDVFGMRAVTFFARMSEVPDDSSQGAHHFRGSWQNSQEVGKLKDDTS